MFLFKNGIKRAAPGRLFNTNATFRLFNLDLAGNCFSFLLFSDVDV